MSYSVWLTSIEETVIDIDSLRIFCNDNDHLKFDTSKTWTDSYDQVVLFKVENNWDFVCGINNKSTFAECADPYSIAFFEVTKIADLLNLFVVGDENEIYYIPNYGKPFNRLDFDIAKQVFNENGYNIKLIIEKSSVI